MTGIFRPPLGWRGAAAVLSFLSAIGPASTRPLCAGENQSLAGQLLVATAEMGDPRFAETVIYMVQHDENGAMGLVINRPIAKGPIADLLRGLGVESRAARGEIVIHYGGPVEPEKAFVLHSDDYAGRGTTVVGGGIAVAADAEIVRALAEGRGPRQSLFTLGYAGWAPGQLEAEIRANAWFTIPAEKKLIFDDDPETKWEHAMARRKIKT